MQVFSWPEGSTAPGAPDSGSVVAPQSQGDEQEPITVLLGGAWRTCYTVPLQTRAAHVLWEMLIPAQGWGLDCLLPSHQTKAEEASSTLRLSSSGPNKMGGTSASPAGQEPLLVGCTDVWG